MSKLSIRKGKNFERLIARYLRYAFPDARRGFQFRGITEQYDIENTGIFAIECKHHKRVSISKEFTKFKKICAQKHQDKIPVLVSRDNRGDILATLDFKHFVCLLSLLLDKMR